MDSGGKKDAFYISRGNARVKETKVCSSLFCFDAIGKFILENDCHLHEHHILEADLSILA